MATTAWCPSMKVIWNYTVPVDNAGKIILCHDTVLPLVEVAWEGLGLPAPGSAVRFWTIHLEDDMYDVTRNWEFCVFGTGKEIPSTYEYVGTAPRTPSGLVWHLFRRPV